MELLIAVSFVLLGSMIIQGSFLRAADLFGRYVHTLGIQRWMNESTAEAKQRIMEPDPVEPGADPQAPPGYLIRGHGLYVWADDMPGALMRLASHSAKVHPLGR